MGHGFRLELVEAALAPRQKVVTATCGHPVVTHAHDSVLSVGDDRVFGSLDLMAERKANDIR